MEKEIKDRYNQAILEEAMRLYGIEVGRIHLLDGFESFIYEFETGDCAYILRVAHSIRRNVNLIHGEVDWINYLSAGGAPVAKAIRSDLGRLVEVVDDAHSSDMPPIFRYRRPRYMMSSMSASKLTFRLMGGASLSMALRPERDRPAVAVSSPVRSTATRNRS